MLPPSLERLRPFEPMRYLHLLYLFFFLIAGGLLGQLCSRRHAYRWALAFRSARCAGCSTRNAKCIPHPRIWNCLGPPPITMAASFRLDSRQHSNRRFVRARSALCRHCRARTITASARWPSAAFSPTTKKMAAWPPACHALAPRWLREVTALNGWRNFQPADFERLKNEFGVTWIVLSRADALYSQPARA